MAPQLPSSPKPVSAPAEPATQAPGEPSSPGPDDRTTLGKSWWRRYSPHGEFFWSSGISLAIHLFLVVLVIVVAAPLLRPDPSPPAVDAIALVDGEDGRPGDGEGSPGDALGSESAEAKRAPPAPPDVASVDPVEIKKVEKPDLEPAPQPAVPPADAMAGEEQVEEARQRIAAARAALGERFRKPDKPAGGQGTGTGGDGTGTGRGGRVARWILKFRTASTADYLEQLEGLGATVGLPLAGQRGDRWRFFDRPASAKDRWSDRDLSGESRIHWVDENAQNARSISLALDVPAAPFIVAFLPPELENRMLELELSYQNRREEEIRSTTFEVLRRGGKYDVMVLKQVLK